MNKFEFNTDLMSWTKEQMGSTNFNITGVIIRFSDETYFKQCLPVFKSLNQKPFKIAFTNPNSTNSETYFLEMVTITSLDIINNVNKTDVTLDNFSIQGCLRCQNTGLPNDINNMWMYLLYE